MFDLGREASGVVDRAIDLETVTLADDEVVVTVSGRGVTQPVPALLSGDFFCASLTSSSVSASASPPSVTCSPTISSDGDRSTVSSFEPVQFRPRKTRETFGALLTFGATASTSSLATM